MAAGRVFEVFGENQTMSTGSVMIAGQTAASGAGSVLEFMRLEINQNSTTTAAQLRAEIATRDTAGTLTTTSVTPANTVLGGPASGLSGNTSVIGGAGRIGITSSADSGGTYTQRRPFNFNNLNGYLDVPTPEERIIIPPSTVFVVRFVAAPGTLTGWSYCLCYRELI
jgi:hypothetical protein